MRLTLLLIFSAPFAFTVAQDYGASTFKEILSFQMSQYLDTINCCEYDSLKNTIDKFNHQQRQKAWEIADSLSKVENPCYEFFIEFRVADFVKDESANGVYVNGQDRVTAWEFRDGHYPHQDCEWCRSDRKNNLDEEKYIFIAY